jgi:hypothetical protein
MDKGRAVRLPTPLPGMLRFIFLFVISYSSARCAEILYDGRAQPNFDASLLDNSTGPYLTYVNFTFGTAPIHKFDTQRRQGI